jgi:hypothetical protein
MSRLITLVGYAVIVGSMLTYAIVARRRPDRLTLGDSVTLAHRHPAGRWLLLAGWLWLGWHLFVRVHR